MEILSQDGSMRVINNPSEIQQDSFGANYLELWPLCQYETPEAAGDNMCLRLVVPSSGRVEALVSANIVIRQQKQTAAYCLQVELDRKDYEKLKDYLKSHQSREAKLQRDAKEWLKSFPEGGTQLKKALEIFYSQDCSDETK